jgi:hypothetical protein
VTDSEQEQEQERKPNVVKGSPGRTRTNKPAIKFSEAEFMQALGLIAEDDRYHIAIVGGGRKGDKTVGMSRAAACSDLFKNELKHDNFKDASVSIDTRLTRYVPDRSAGAH